MDPDGGSMTEIQQLWGTGTNLLNSFYDDPKVTRIMNTRAGQYLSSHPLVALTVLMFSAMAAVPVGLFFVFALSTLLMCAVGFVFLEGFLLFVGGFTLLTVLSGIALFSVVASAIFSGIYVAASHVLTLYSLNLTKVRSRGKEPRKESECETSKPEETE